MKLYNKLRVQHKRFIYHGYKIYDGGFSFHFSMDDIEFKPSWRHSLPVFDVPFYSNLVFNLGMVELVSYWKAACCPTVEVRCGYLDDFQINWWKKLYKNGLGEFFYMNNIEPDDDFIDIKALNNSGMSPTAPDISALSGCLIPVGGGKDSVVTMQMLKAYGDNLCYMLNPRKAAISTAHLAGFSDNEIIIFNRTIDKELLRLNKEGYLNGHTPFSAIIAFSSYIAAYLTKKKYITLSNESSANEGNVAGSKINHQYSKSTEFESDFRHYTKYSFGVAPEYFSLLRPLNEWQITKKFMSYGGMARQFQSCNVGTKTDSWCGVCAKCLYVYIMLAAFLQDVELVEIFGVNMLKNEDLSGMLDALVYESADKPFECVGTREEIRHALKMAYKLREGKEIPPMLSRFIEQNGSQTNNEIDFYFDKNNFVPQEFLHLFDEWRAKNDE
ncbi:MAG: hypothetical protein FWH05_00345 [Oscillospiraceae bacterium]|nr:hypothetical protein [Oscillospiraceae bacterium]